MIILAYFQHDSQCSDIEKFTDIDKAHKWLYDRLGHLLEEDDPPSTLRELIVLLINNCSVMVEIIEI